MPARVMIEYSVSSAFRCFIANSELRSLVISMTVTSTFPGPLDLHKVNKGFVNLMRKPATKYK